MCLCVESLRLICGYLDEEWMATKIGYWLY
jgi:hypothetical protein